MIFTQCQRCRKRIPVGAVCPCLDRGRDRRGTGSVKAGGFYQSEEWGTARARAIRRTYGLDIVALYEFGEIVHGFTVHHIEPLETGWELRTQLDNLIYLTERNHRLIHQRYKTDAAKTKSYLCELLKKFDKEFGANRDKESLSAEGKI